MAYCRKYEMDVSKVLECKQLCASCEQLQTEKMNKELLNKQCMKAGLQGAIIRLEGKITSRQYLELLSISYNLDWLNSKGYN